MDSSQPEPEVFESPDVPENIPAFVERAPAGTRATEIHAQVDVADVVEHTLNARENFEVFMGRRYDPVERSFDVDAVLVQQPLFPSDERFDALARHLTKSLESGLQSGKSAVNVPKKLETPLQRYSRLLQEVSALQSELRAVEAADARRAPGTTVVDHASGVFKVLDGGAAVVQQQLEKLSGEVQAAAASAPAAGAIDAVTPAAPTTERMAMRQMLDQIGALHQAQLQLAAANQSVTAALAGMQHRLETLLSGPEGGASS